MAIAATTKIDLLLLGLLLDRPMHGYELYQQIKTEQIDDWFNVSMAGVYYSLGKLHEQGWVIESHQRAGSARKSIYQLTEEGRSAFFKAMEAQALSEERVYLDYDLVIYLLNKLPLGRAMSLLEAHHAFLTDEAARVEAALSAERGRQQPSLALAVLDHRWRYLDMEKAWLAGVIADIQGENGDPTGTLGHSSSLMVLSGDLYSYHLPDLVRLIASGRHSGTLAVTDGTHARTVTFKEGQPVCATARRHGEPARIPQSRREVLEGLYDLFRWQEGTFSFDQHLESEEYCVALQMSARELILQGSRWVDNWDIIQRLIPSADVIFEHDAGTTDLDESVLTAVEKRVLAAIDGIKDMSVIARELELTVFEASRTFYCLAAAGLLRAADLDKIRLRRVFREIAELMCSSTIAWRSSPDDRSCEDAVNERAADLPLCLNRGRIEDQTEPHLRTDELVDLYRAFLLNQLDVVSQRFGRVNARQSFERTLRQLAPELQEVARRYGLDRLLEAGAWGA